MENLIHDLNLINSKVDSIAVVVNAYVEWKKDDKNFLEYLKKKREKKDDKQGIADKDSK